MTDWHWPDPFQLLPLGLLPIPTDYHFLFDPIPSTGIIVGLLCVLARGTRAAVRPWMIATMASVMLLAMVALLFVAQRYTLDYAPGSGCRLANPSHYITVRPLFVPEGLEKFLPSHGFFDGMTCTDFNEQMFENDGPGWFATLFAMAALLAVPSACLGAIFGWLLKLWRVPAARV
jgi:hypothetical protein